MRQILNELPLFHFKVDLWNRITILYRMPGAERRAQLVLSTNVSEFIVITSCMESREFPTCVIYHGG